MGGLHSGSVQRVAREVVPLLLVAAIFLYAVWPWLPSGRSPHRPRTLVFYGFSILGEVMTKAVLPAFQESWLRRTGEHVEFLTAFAGSGTITNQMILGVPADVCLLALELDAYRLQDAGLTRPHSWRALPDSGTVNRTPFVILVRPGNPKRIADFADLGRDGIAVVHPDPMSSGGANWALLAEYGAAMRRHPENPRAGHDQLLGIWRNVVAQPPSARAARTQFENGFGDALITYEQEALADRAGKEPGVEVVDPPSTILSEHTLVVLDRNVRPEERDLVRAFVEFLWSEPAQRLFVQYGFRSVDPSLNRDNAAFGRIPDLFRIDAFGGWKQAKREIVDGVWRQQVLHELDQR